MFDYLVNLLRQNGANYKLIKHEPEGNSERVAQVRGTAVGQGAKAMVCKIRGADFYAMAVVPGDKRVNLKKVAAVFGFARASFLPADQTVEITGCVVGAISPFSAREDIRVVADPALSNQYDEIAFNAGRLDASIILSSEDYIRIAKPYVASICE